MSQDNHHEEFAKRIEAFVDRYDRIVAEVSKVVVGHGEVIDGVLACMFGRGHVLLEGAPGLGKTLLVHTLADVLDLSFSRIQFTPDLMPADITGTNIIATGADGEMDFEFRPGPIFANIVLADEINRATPKTQSAVLEAMQERTVTVAPTTHELLPPFFVLATQNPLEMNGTYPLPISQLDRFMLKINVTMSDVDELESIIDRTTGADSHSPSRVADADVIMQMCELVRNVEVASHVRRYIAELIVATHPDSETAPESIRTMVRYGASVRGGQSVVMAAKVRALRFGRINISFDDVEVVAHGVLRHRLILSFEGQAHRVSVEELIADVLQSVKRTRR